ncbi:MAG: AbrB/MazE/SpoVT family DNA-binding domain-containing protein [Rhizobiales bacterium]|nr:AbrB/MazE/SpoVT family DNA-binding domain-containing protein [Hyphomicrobiales bacterium]
MKTAIRKLGNSHGVIIPKPLLAEIGANADDPIDIKVKKGKIIITPLKRERSKEHDPRPGWVEECRAIRETGEDRLVWPDAGDADDDKPVL